MKIAIMQPYFFPYIGYFQLINAVDKFVILDTVQFIRHGWIERNRVLKQTEDWVYIKVPLKKHDRNTLIQNIEIRDENWQQKIIAQLQHYKKKAPFYNNVVELLAGIFDEKYKTITELNYESLKHVCSYLEIKTPISVFSEMNLQIDTIADAGEWALNISKFMKAATYINPVGGLEIFDKEKFDSNKINLEFLETQNITYKQKGNQFEAGLSIIDVMMFNSPEEITEMLTKYTIRN